MMGDEVSIYLFEQIYRINRIYWHGSSEDFDEFKESSQGIFLSTSKDFAIKFTNKMNASNDDACRVYMCKLVKPVNLFNIASERDRKLISKYFKSIKMEFNINNCYKEMKKNQSPMRSWSVMEKDFFIKAYHELGYDGFTTTEQLVSRDGEREDYVENISIFDTNNIKILEKYFYDRGAGALNGMKHNTDSLEWLGDEYKSPIIKKWK
jgi:hypothetical protein